MKQILSIIFLIYAGEVSAQEWWDLKYHEGGDGGAMNNSNLQSHLHRDPKSLNQDKVALGTASNPFSLTKAAKKRMEAMDEEIRIAILDLKNKFLKDSVGSFSNCKFCGGLGTDECHQCQGNGYNECSSCKGRSRVCRTCDGAGVINEQPCGSCSGTGERPCNFCKGTGKNACADCAGVGYLNCAHCHGARRTFVPGSTSNSTDTVKVVSTPGMLVESPKHTSVISNDANGDSTKGEKRKNRKRSE